MQCNVADTCRQLRTALCNHDQPAQTRSLPAAWHAAHRKQAPHTRCKAQAGHKHTHLGPACHPRRSPRLPLLPVAPPGRPPPAPAAPRPGRCWRGVQHVAVAPHHLSPNSLSPRMPAAARQSRHPRNQRPE